MRDRLIVPNLRFRSATTATALEKLEERRALCRHRTARVRALPEVGEGVVEAVTSVFSLEYDIGWGWREVIEPGAFDESIGAQESIPIFWEHAWRDPDAVIGHTMEIDADASRLRIQAQLYVDDPGVKKIWRAMDAKALREWSIGYYAEEISWTAEDPMLDHIEKGDLAECSVVVRGANPETETLDVRNRRLDDRRRRDDDEDPEPPPPPADVDEEAEAAERGARADRVARALTNPSLRDALRQELSSASIPSEP